jgi:hypothetical protein
MLYGTVFGLKKSRTDRAKLATHSLLDVSKKLATIPGKTMIETAKMSGIIPAELTFNGM